jgi:hypothetical protein
MEMSIPAKHDAGTVAMTTAIKDFEIGFDLIGFTLLGVNPKEGNSCWSRGRFLG